MSTPISSGMPNSRLRPMAVPITSAMSVAMMAISASSHSGQATQRGIGVAAGLRQIAARGDGEPRAERLQHDRHDVGEQRDDQQRVAEFRPAGERGRPVAGVHVADGDEIARAEEGGKPPPVALGQRDGPVHIGQRPPRRACDRFPAACSIAGASGHRVLGLFAIELVSMSSVFCDCNDSPMRGPFALRSNVHGAPLALAPALV